MMMYVCMYVSVYLSLYEFMFLLTCHPNAIEQNCPASSDKNSVKTVSSVFCASRTFLFLGCNTMIV